MVVMIAVVWCFVVLRVLAAAMIFIVVILGHQGVGKQKKAHRRKSQRAWQHGEVKGSCFHVTGSNAAELGGGCLS
jgi:hypothetical protein